MDKLNPEKSLKPFTCIKIKFRSLPAFVKVPCWPRCLHTRIHWSRQKQDSSPLQFGDVDVVLRTVVITVSCIYSCIMQSSAKCAATKSITHGGHYCLLMSTVVDVGSVRKCDKAHPCFLHHLHVLRCHTSPASFIPVLWFLQSAAICVAILLMMSVNVILHHFH